MFALDIGARLTLVDLLVANDDNVPATIADLPSYRAKMDTPHTIALDAPVRNREGDVEPSIAAVLCAHRPTNDDAAQHPGAIQILTYSICVCIKSWIS